MSVFKKNDNWWIDCYINGQRVRRKIGPNKRTAELAEKKLKVDAAQGKWLGEINLQKIKFADFFTKKFQPRLQGAVSTKKNYRVAFNKHLDAEFGKHFLHQIKPEHIEDYKARRVQEARASSVNQELVLLGAILNRAVEWKYLRENPAQSVKKLRVAETEYNTLTVEEANALFEVEPKNDWFYTFLAVALNTGMRVSEILALTWEDIDFKSRIVSVVNDDDFETKSKKIRYMPMNDFLRDVLRKHPPHISCDLIFASKKGNRQGLPIHRNSVELRLNQAVIEAKIDGHYRIHDLRHSFGTRLADNGENPRTIMELMGHSSIEVTMRYIHTTTDKKQEAVKRLGFGGKGQSSKGRKKPLAARA